MSSKPINRLHLTPKEQDLLTNLDTALRKSFDSDPREIFITADHIPETSARLLTTHLTQEHTRHRASLASQNDSLAFRIEKLHFLERAKGHKETFVDLTVSARPSDDFVLWEERLVMEMGARDLKGYALRLAERVVDLDQMERVARRRELFVLGVLAGWDEA